MVNALYAKGREKFLRGEISWNADDIKAVLVDAADYTVNLAVHEFLSDIPVGGRVSTSANFAGKTTTAGTADADNITFLAVTGDVSEALVIYKDTGVAGTSPLIAWIDVAVGLPVVPNSGDLTIVFDSTAAKIFTL